MMRTAGVVPRPRRCGIVRGSGLLLLRLLLLLFPASAAPHATIDGRACFRSLAGTIEAMFALASRYPRLASVSDIGDSFLKTARDGNNDTRRDARAASDDGHDIYALNVTAADGPLPSADRAKVLVLSGVHPRELAPPELALRFAERLAAGYGADADVTWLLRRVEVHFVLHANPDGRRATEARPGAARVRKNLNPGGCG